MAENKKADSGNTEARQTKKESKKLIFYLVLALATVALYAALIAVAIWHPGIHERVRFGTENGLTLAIVIAVVAQVVIYTRQWWIMKSSLIYAHRAYVVAKIEDIGPYDDLYQFRLRIENDGNTPANDVVIFYSYGLRDQPTGDASFTENERLGVVAPNGGYHVIKTPTVAIPYPITTPEHKQYASGWASGNLKFYCWGRITYKDIFNERRHTDFCFLQSQKQPNGYPCKHSNEAY